MKKIFDLWVYSHPALKKLIMELKIATFIIVVSVSNVLAIPAYSKVAKVTLDIENRSLEQVMDEIESQSEFYFIFNQKQVDVNRVVDIQAENKLITDILPELFKGTNVNYAVFDRKILLTTDSLGNNLLAIASGTELQQKVVTGTVTDPQGLPLVGVSVSIKGTTLGVLTDEAGRYTLSNFPDNATLVFSFVGMTTKEVPLNGQTRVDVTLAEESIGLDEVVVIGYGTQKKKDITTSVSTIKMETIEKRSMANLAQALQGKASGVRVIQASGSPEGDFSVQVRGATSITAGNEPLYVVDGIPTSSIRGINPADIESMQILKDASSCAIYGARAANGVVLINTKRGEANKPLVSFRAVYSVSQVAKKLDLLDAKECARLLNDEKINAGMSPIIDPDTISTNIDWQDEIFFKGYTSDMQLSFSGGNEKTQFYLSAGRIKSEGIIKPSKYERYSFKVNMDHKMFKWLSLGSSINLSKSKNSNITDTDPTHGQGVILEALAYTTPYTPKYKPNGDFGSNPHQGGWDNPYSFMYGSNAATRISSLLGNVFAKVTIAKGLSFKTSMAIDTYYNNFDQFDLQAHSEYNRSLGGNALANSSQQLVWLNENILDYNYSSGKHAITALAGMTRQKSHWESSALQKRGFPDDKVQTLNAGAVIMSGSTDASEWALQSYLLRMTYAFDNKYLFSVNFRTDGSSKFGPSNKFGYFPSASVGWRISQEDFFSNIRAVNDLKIRVSYGLTGNQNGIGEYSHLGLIGLGAVYAFDSSIYPGSYPSTISNKDLKWESTKQTDIGIDLSLLKSRITITADVYYKNTSDLLVNVNLPTSTGYSSGIQNLGKINNKGLEIEFNTYNFTGKFKWNTDVNFSINRNKVIDIGGKDKIMYTAGIIRERGQITIIKEGQPLSMFYGYISEGVDPQTGDIIYKRNSVSTEYSFSADSDRFIIGNPNPKFIYGITNSFSYKDFSLSILLQGVYGNDIFNGTRLNLEDMEQVKNASASALRRWRNPGDITDIPRAVFGNSDNSLASSRFVEKGTYLRVKSITLSYDFNSNWLKKAYISSLNVFVSAQNLLTFTKYSGFDPEVSWAGNTGSGIDNAVSLGVEYGTYPNVRTFNVGINVNF
jgi:TonB-linked SusC/RagA family outer membrane protein